MSLNVMIHLTHVHSGVQDLTGQLVPWNSEHLLIYHSYGLGNVEYRSRHDCHDPCHNPMALSAKGQGHQSDNLWATHVTSSVNLKVAIVVVSGIAKKTPYGLKDVCFNHKSNSTSSLWS